VPPYDAIKDVTATISPLPPSILLSSLPSRGLPGGSGQSPFRSPAAKHFDAIYTVKQPYKIRIDV